MERVHTLVFYKIFSQFFIIFFEFSKILTKSVGFSDGFQSRLVPVTGKKSGLRRISNGI